MQIIEICSYPKSGNTWLRNLISQFLTNMQATGNLHSTCIHTAKDKLLKEISEEQNSVLLPQLKEAVYFYKSHIPFHPKVNPNKVIYIYRHPLDVLLSTINWFNIRYQNNHNALPKRRLSTLFLNGEPKSCDEIKADGEINYYIEKFTNDLGESTFPNMLGVKSNYFTHVNETLNSENVCSLKYEDLFNNTSEVITNLINQVLNLNIEKVEIDADFAKNDYKNKGFYWKGKSGTRFDYFSDDQIVSFENKHAENLKRIGYVQK